MSLRSVCAVILWLGLCSQAPAPRFAGRASFRISGTVVDSRSGEPLGKAEVDLGAVSGGDTSRRLLTAPDGRFLFELLPPGKYVLSAKRKGFVQQYFQQHEGGFSTGVAVGPGLDSENLIFPLLPAATISGRITDESADSVRGAEVMLFHEDFHDGKKSTTLQRQTASDSEGRFHFGRLLPGRYFVAVSAHPWYAQHPLRQPADAGGSNAVSGFRLLPPAGQNASLDVAYPITFYGGATESSAASAINLLPGEAATADVPLHPVPALHLFVKAPNVDPSQGVDVQVTQRTFDGHEVYQRTQTAFMDNHIIEIMGVAPGPVVIKMNSSNEKGRFTIRRALVASADAELSLAESASGPLISGIIKTPGASDFPQGATVQIHSRETGETMDASITADGSFDFQNRSAKPGSYELSISNLADFHLERVQAEHARIAGRSLEIRGTESVRLTLFLTKGFGSVVGMALREGKPASGVMILLVPQDSQSDPSQFRRDQSDSDGTFSLARLPPGQYILLAVDDGWDAEWANPLVLKKWLAGGEIVRVVSEGQLSIKVKVQPASAASQ
ncbi:MAG TPA: carboxypeptidase-like regulatory domain-containing protein [Candidatus Acidoferrales bacterium]|jgi:hypothetical protein|nr:carboxypeptidase-like regulatory domain-containing protein [Candidatus Acidoferrales bacterium]